MNKEGHEPSLIDALNIKVGRRQFLKTLPVIVAGLAVEACTVSYYRDEFNYRSGHYPYEIVDYSPSSMVGRVYVNAHSNRDELVVRGISGYLSIWREPIGPWTTRDRYVEWYLRGPLFKQEDGNWRKGILDTRFTTTTIDGKEAVVFHYEHKNEFARSVYRIYFFTVGPLVPWLYMKHIWIMEARHVQSFEQRGVTRASEPLTNELDLFDKYLIKKIKIH
ncbi:hypothetical protein HY388_01485 [Candidatus Daviesbacteria bacterium]|nr:hypothetical protein [Candidatus Daviesbacteria bacterium]